MELKLVNSTVELSGLLIMGIIDLNTDDPLDLDEIAEIASGYAASGATFVELSVNSTRGMLALKMQRLTCYVQH